VAFSIEGQVLAQEQDLGTESRLGTDGQTHESKPIAHQIDNEFQ
jgi:hypothetical protein